MTLLNEADRITIGAAHASAVYADGVKVWPPTPADAFPTTGILDNFNRPNESPPAGWIAPGFNDDYGPLSVVANQLKAPSAWHSNAWGQKVTGDQEAYCDVVAYNPGSTLYFWLDIQQSSIDNLHEYPAHAYQARIYGNGYTAELGVSGPTGIQLGQVTLAPQFAAGDGIGLRIKGDLISLWRRAGAGGQWQKLIEAADTSWPRSGYIGVEGNDSTHIFDNVGGGAIPKPLPATLVLDNFNRADGPVGTNWIGLGFAQCGAGPAVVSNQAARSAGEPYASAVWHTKFNGDMEVYADITAQLSNGGNLILHTYLQQSDVDNVNIYPPHSYYMRVLGANANVQIVAATTHNLTADSPPQAGDTFLLRCVAGYLSAWRKRAGAWSQIGVDIAVPASPYVSGYVGFELWSPDPTVIDNFGGGLL